MAKDKQGLYSSILSNFVSQVDINDICNSENTFNNEIKQIQYDCDAKWTNHLAFFLFLIN